MNLDIFSLHILWTIVLSQRDTFLINNIIWTAKNSPFPRKQWKVKFILYPLTFVLSNIFFAQVILFSRCPTTAVLKWEELKCLSYPLSLDTVCYKAKISASSYKEDFDYLLYSSESHYGEGCWGFMYPEWNACKHRVVRKVKNYYIYSKTR